VFFQELDFEVESQFLPAGKNKRVSTKFKIRAISQWHHHEVEDTAPSWHIVTRKLCYLAGVGGAPTLRLHVALVLCRLKKSIHELLRHAFKRVSGRGARSFIGGVAARCNHWEHGGVALHVLLCAAMIRVCMR